MTISQCLSSENVNHKAIYLTLFGKIPSEFTYHNKTKVNTDFKLNKFNKEYLQKILNESSYIITIDDCFETKALSYIIDESKQDENAIQIETNEIYSLGSYKECYFAAICKINNKPFIISIDSDSITIVHSLDDNIDVIGIAEFLNKHLERKDEEDQEVIAKIKMISTGKNGYETTSAEINKVNINLEQNYNDDFKDAYTVITNFIGSSERKSGLILLNGKPGTGKTYFLRHLITKFTDLDFIVIPSSLTSHISSPEFINFLIKNKNAVFILEDCEQAIKDRSSNNGYILSAVSNILNLSDGLMGDVCNIKFICTFNAKIASIDDALLRKGRCKYKYEFKPLCVEKANKLFKELKIDASTDKPLTLADIYNYNDETNKDFISSAEKREKIGF